MVLSFRPSRIWLPCVFALGSCASGPDNGGRSAGVELAELWPELASTDPEVRARAAADGTFPARRPPAASVDRLVEAENAYRRGDAEFLTHREALSEDRVEAFWLTRMLVRDALVARDRAPVGEVAMVQEPRWERPIRHLVQMGERAAPCIAADLLNHPQAHRRQFARDVLTQMGPSALPSWEGAMRVSSPKARRYGVEVVASWEEQSADSRRLLQEAADDSDFGVRAAAYAGFWRLGPQVAVLLQDAMVSDRDPFVQRAIAGSLAHFPSRASGQAVLDFMARSVEDGDERSIHVADQALQKMSGRTVRTSLIRWRKWLDELPPDA